MALPTIAEERPSKQEQLRQRIARSFARRKPLEQMTKAMIGSIFGCAALRCKSYDHKEGPGTSSAAAGKLVEKQEAIDMLEWQLKYLQNAADQEREVMGNCCVSIVHHCMEHKVHHGSTSGSAEGDAPIASSTTSSPDFPTKLIVQTPPHTTTTSYHGTHHGKGTSNELLLEVTIVRATLSIRKFCKVFMKQLEASGYSVWRSLADLEPRTSFQKKGHTVFALESRVNRVLFRNFENESFDELGITTILDPSERAMQRLGEFQRLRKLEVLEAFKVDAEFAGFCERKTKELWAGFTLWSIVFEAPEERSSFTNAFMDACKGVWLLHRLAFSVEPVAEIIRVGKGMEADPDFVEPVVIVVQPQRPPGPQEPHHSQDQHRDVVCGICKAINKVDFMVMPGFRSQSVVIKCQVYPHLQCRE